MIKLERAKKLFEDFEVIDSKQTKLLFWYLLSELEANNIRNTLYYYLRYILSNNVEKYGLVVKVLGKETLMLTPKDIEKLIRDCEAALRSAKQPNLDQTLFF